VLENSEGSRREALAAESLSHVLRLPAWAGHPKVSREEAALSITEPLVISGSVQGRSILHLCLDPLSNSSLRLLSAVGDF